METNWKCHDKKNGKAKKALGKTPTMDFVCLAMNDCHFVCWINTHETESMRAAKKHIVFASVLLIFFSRSSVNKSKKQMVYDIFIGITLRSSWRSIDWNELLSGASVLHGWAFVFSVLAIVVCSLSSKEAINSICCFAIELFFLAMREALTTKSKRKKRDNCISPNARV